MKIKILQNWRTSLAFVLMAIFINWQIVASAITPYESKYSTKYYSNVYDAVVAYHSKLNDLMNDKIEILVSGDYEEEQMMSEDCSDEDNISTYCLAEEMVSEYIEFRAGLEDHAIYAIDSDDTEIAMVIETVATKSKARNQLITLEQENAIKIMDMALAAYNELQIALPIHNSYKETIKDLEDYNSALGDLRTEIAEWESKFIDVSTTDCK